MSFSLIEHGRVQWVNIIHPDEEDLRQLKARFTQFHPLNLEDCLSRIERPKIDEYPDHLFIVMHFPVWDAQKRISWPAEVDFFIGAGYVVTVHEGDLKALKQIYDTCEADAAQRPDVFGLSSGHLLYAIIDRLVDAIFPILYKVESNIRAIEENLFAEDARRIIQSIAIERRDLIALRRIMRPQLGIIANLEQADRPYIREDLDVYFGDILDHLRKARDIIEENSELIAGLADTSDALASHRINEVMRILTVISVIMLPLTLISGILGMNVDLPVPADPALFWIILLVMGLVALAMLAFFRFRRWL